MSMKPNWIFFTFRRLQTSIEIQWMEKCTHESRSFGKCTWFHGMQYINLDEVENKYTTYLVNGSARYVPERIPVLIVMGIVYLRYNFMDPSVSPREFFATHLYMPKSLMSTEMIVSFMETLYVLSSSSALYFPPIRWEYAKYHNYNKIYMSLKLVQKRR